MLKKYHVFISSTLDDLKAERRELIKVVTELGAVPVTMDGFDISDTEEQRFIKKAVEESDYFINLTAHKCGVQAGKSFSLEMEFGWAEKYRIPVISFIIDEKARWKAIKKEKEAQAVKALENLKKKLRNHTHETWTSAADLRQKSLNVLAREMNLNPREGWVRGEDAVIPAVANELAILIRDNEKLRTQALYEEGDYIARLKEQMKNCLKVLATNKISLSFWYVQGDNWENTRKFRYLRLFKLLTPELSVAKTTSEISRFLGNILNPDLEKTVRKDYPTPTNTIKKLMADLSLLKLVKTSIGEGKGGSVASENDEAWEISDYGREIYAAYRLRQMERVMLRVQRINRNTLKTEV